MATKLSKNYGIDTAPPPEGRRYKLHLTSSQIDTVTFGIYLSILTVIVIMLLASGAVLLLRG